MQESQRDALVEMMRAILAVDHCPPDIRFRAESLMGRLVGNPFDDALSSFSGFGFGR